MRDLNEMKELSTIVNFLLDNPDMAHRCHKLSVEELDIFIHNFGNRIARHGDINETELLNTRASMYLSDLIHSICIYIEDGNSISITENNPMYQNIEE